MGEVVPFSNIVFDYAFPVSLVAPRFEWRIEPSGSGSTFTAISYVRAGDFFRLLRKKEMDWKVAATRQHTKEEGEYLQPIFSSSSEQGHVEPAD